MEQHELLLFAVDCLDKLNIPYLITGSMASMAYGEPRFTNDIDIVADVRLDQVEAMKACFPEDDFYLETESMKKAIVRRQQFNIIHPSSGLKIDRTYLVSWADKLGLLEIWRSIENALSP